MDPTPSGSRPAADGTAPTDELGEFIALAQKGDEDAFRSIYRAVQPGLLRYLRGLVGDDAEDVASEAWSQIARDLGGFRGDGRGFRGWAATVARNRALDHLRRESRQPRRTGMSAEDLADRAAAEDTLGAAMDRVATDEAIALIATLPRDQAEAVLLRVVMGLDVATTAQVLGKRPGAIRTSAYRGLRRLAHRLADPVGQVTDSPRKPRGSDDGQGGPGARA